jgi:hypothetical protein
VVGSSVIESVPQGSSSGAEHSKDSMEPPFSTSSVVRTRCQLSLVASVESVSSTPSPVAFVSGTVVFETLTGRVSSV